jgi:para-nitrobenzyl esterase
MHGGKSRLIVVVSAVALAACGSSAASGPITTATPPPVSPAAAVVGGDPLTLRTPQGVVHGTLAGSARAFLGIPFAAAPVGPRRWQAPQPAAHWTPTLQAAHLSAPCPQTIPVVNSYEGSEDCLYANVYAPGSVPTAPRPVLVWIYGGGFTVGSSGDDSVANMAARQGAVAVSFNYRLGPLGFLALSSLATEDPHHGTGNLGLLDQQAALRWVRDNIAAYGGDPHQVTIYGESAGGISVCAQLVSPASAGLFQRAITESGPCTLPAQPLATAEHQGTTLATALGCPTDAAELACIRTKPVRQVIQAVPPEPLFLFGRGARWGPVVDGVTVPGNVPRLLATGHFHRVPVIVGANRDEGRLFVGLRQLEIGSPLTAARWAASVTAYFGPTTGARVIRQYPLSAYPDAGAALGQAVGDAVLTCPAVASAKALSRWVPVYEYEYDHAPNPFILATPGIDLGAFHAAELPYVFGAPTQSSGNFGFTPAEQQLSDTVAGAWARFAVTGSPSGGGLAWPRLTSPSGPYLVLDTPTSSARAMKAAPCGFWASTGWTAADKLAPSMAGSSTVTTTVTTSS